MCGFRFRRSVGVPLDVAGFVVLKHIVGVAVVGSHNHDAAGFFDCFAQPSDLDIKSFH